jgi:TonB family protein
MLLPGMGLVQHMFQIRGTRSGLSSRPRYVSLITPVLICLSQIGLATAREQRAMEADQSAVTSANMTTSPPVLLSKSDIENCPYSVIAKTRFEGTTRLHVLIDHVGQPTAVTVTNSSGSRALDAAAVACAKKAHFQAATGEGKPVDGQFSLSVKWELLPSADACSPSMTIAWGVTVSVEPSPTAPPSPIPVNAESVVCACMNGKNASEPVILSSSGVQRLDEGAIKLMKKSTERWNNTDGCIAGAFHFSAEPPARTVDGK